VLYGAVWLVIMAKVCHYWSEPVFSLYQIDHPWLRLNCLNGSIRYYLKKYISW
jgi:hypothetical protein